MNKYRLLLFDLDGTLCDTDEMIVQTMLSIYRQYKPVKERSREELYYFSGPPIKETLKNEFPDQDPQLMYEVFKKVSKGFYKSTVKAYQDEIKILDALKKHGYKLGVVTNKGLPLTLYSLEICHIESFFDVVISADDVDSPKPSPEGIKMAMKRLDILNKEEVLYIGDNDIDDETAKNADVDSLLVTWGPRTIKRIKQANYLAKSYSEIGDILL